MKSRLIFIIIVLIGRLIGGFYRIQIKPASIKKTDTIGKEIPKRIWTYWDAAPIPTFITSCVASWTRYNPNHNVTILNRQSINTLLRIPLPSNFDSIQAQFQADWVRLAILAQEGGIWIDSSFILTTSLDKIHSLQVSEATEGFMFYLAGFTTDLSNKYYENWFIGAVENSTLIKAWLSEFSLVFESFGMRDSYLVYLRSTLSTSTYTNLIQKNSLPSYLKQHIALQKVMQIDHMPHFSTIEATAEGSPLWLMNKLGWDAPAFGKAFIEKWEGKAPSYIKLSSEARRAVMVMVDETKLSFLNYIMKLRVGSFTPSSESLYAKYVLNI